MNDTIYVRILLENFVKSAVIGNIDIVETRPLAADQLDTIDGLLGRIVKIVSNDDLVASFQQC